MEETSLNAALINSSISCESDFNLLKKKEKASDFSSPDCISNKGKSAAVVVCWILGFGSLISWNSLVTIEDYYYNLFPNYHPSRVLTLVYQPFAVGTVAILAYYESKINTRRRNLIGYTLFTVSTFLLIVLDLATSGKGGIGPFLGICAVVATFGVSDALVQGGMIGDLSFMRPEFIQSFFAGMAASGALTSALRLVTKAAFEKYKNGLRDGTMLFLAISTCFEFICVILYAFYFPKLPIVKYYRSKAALEGSKTVSSDLAAAGIHSSENQGKEMDRLSNKELLIQNIDYALDLYLIYVLTLSIFPGFLYENTGQHQLGAWYSLVLVACYNGWDLVGRYIPLIKWVKIENRKGLMIAILSRFLLIPAFYFTAKYGDQGYMIFLVSLLGLTNGHLTVCVMTVAPKGYKAVYKISADTLRIGRYVTGFEEVDTDIFRYIGFIAICAVSADIFRYPLRYRILSDIFRDVSVR